MLPPYDVVSVGDPRMRSLQELVVVPEPAPFVAQKGRDGGIESGLGSLEEAVSACGTAAGMKSEEELRDGVGGCGIGYEIEGLCPTIIFPKQKPGPPFSGTWLSQ